MTINEMIKRTGFDPMRFDRRPLSEAMDDCIPYDRWEREAKGKTKT